MAPKTFSTLTKTATNFYYPKSTLVSPKTAQLYLQIAFELKPTLHQ